MRGTHCNHKSSNFTKLFKIYDIYNIFLQTIFRTTWLFLTLGVTVPNTINTHEFRPSVIPGSKFKIPSQYFVVTSLAFLNFCQLLIFYMLLCLHSIIYCKFYTLTNQSLLPWHKYLESLGKSDVFTHVFF